MSIFDVMSTDKVMKLIETVLSVLGALMKLIRKAFDDFDEDENV